MRLPYAPGRGRARRALIIPGEERAGSQQPELFVAERSGLRLQAASARRELPGGIGRARRARRSSRRGGIRWKSGAFTLCVERSHERRALFGILHFAVQLRQEGRLFFARHSVEDCCGVAREESTITVPQLHEQSRSLVRISIVGGEASLAEKSETAFGMRGAILSEGRSRLGFFVIPDQSEAQLRAQAGGLWFRIEDRLVEAGR